MRVKATLDGIRELSSRLFSRVSQSADVEPEGDYGQALMWEKVRHQQLRVRSFDSRKFASQITPLREQTKFNDASVSFYLNLGKRGPK